jgi:hypothetical protein
LAYRTTSLTGLERVRAEPPRALLRSPPLVFPGSLITLQSTVFSLVKMLG